MKLISLRTNSLIVACLVTFSLFPAQAWSDYGEATDPIYGINGPLSTFKSLDSGESRSSPEEQAKREREYYSKACSPYFKEIRAKGANLQRELDTRIKTNKKYSMATYASIGAGVAGAVVLSMAAVPFIVGVAALAGVVAPFITLPTVAVLSGPNSEKIDCLKYAMKSGMNFNVDTPNQPSIATQQIKASRTITGKYSTDGGSGRDVKAQ